MCAMRGPPPGLVLLAGALALLIGWSARAETGSGLAGVVAAFSILLLALMGWLCKLAFDWLVPPVPPGIDLDQLPICHTCGYELTGNVSGVCPECGTPVESKNLPAENRRI
jgi:hypothetical protein